MRRNSVHARCEVDDASTVLYAQHLIITLPGNAVTLDLFKGFLQLTSEGDSVYQVCMSATQYSHAQLECANVLL